jgi:hypothetical protein
MYTDAIGRRLGIVELGSLFNPNEQKPVVSLVAYPGCVNVRFKKYGMKGVTIYSRIKGTLGWEMLGHDYKSPYLDKRSLQEGNQPEIREYMARFFDGHEDIGLSSDVVVIVYGG